MSESLHAGQLPLWNPYINFGIPQYGDMSSGYWSPATWLIASTIGYNAYTLTLEVLFYILLGGIGMYRLVGLWIPGKYIRICAGIAFMCCGYNIGHLQHFNWLSGTAFLPWCLLSYILLLTRFSLRNALSTALFFYMLVASAHPGLTISAFYFFIAVAFYHFFNNKNNERLSIRIKGICKSHLILLVIFLLLGAGMIAGYLDILPHFIRGEKISLQDSLSNPTNLQSWVSALLPFATVKNDGFYNTDPTMRNCYFSLTLLIFFLFACVQKKNKWQFFLLVAGLLFALLAAGGIFKTAAYKVIPFIGYVRLNGEFRIFALLCFIIIAAIELDKFTEQKRQFAGTIRWIYYSLEIILFVCIFWGLYMAIHTKESFIYNSKTVYSQAGLSSKLKAFIDSISFYDTFWLQGFVQMFFLRGIKYCLKSGNWKLLKWFTVINIVFASLFNIPFTGVGKSSVAQVQAVLDKSPKGIPVPPLLPVNSTDTLSTEEKGLVGDWSMYNKQIGVRNQVPYPIVLKNMQEYFNKNEWMAKENFSEQPFIFIDSENSPVDIETFSPCRIAVLAKANTVCQLVLQQNFYPHWFYYNGTVKKSVMHAGINFMSAPVSKGEQHITFSFEPVFVKWMMLISAVSFVIILLLTLLLKNERPQTHS